MTKPIKDSKTLTYIINSDKYKTYSYYRYLLDVEGIDIQQLPETLITNFLKPDEFILLYQLDEGYELKMIASHNDVSYQAVYKKVKALEAKLEYILNNTMNTVLASYKMFRGVDQ